MADATGSPVDGAPSPIEAGLPDGRASVDASSSDASLPFDGAPPPADAGPDVASAPAEAGLCTPATPTSLDVCTGFGSLEAPPVIDGVLDCDVPLWSMPIVSSSGPGPLPNGTRALIAAAWRPDGLYLFVSVSGVGATRAPAPPNDPAWCGDAIELFVDHDGVFPNAPSYNDPGTIQLVAVPPTSTGQPSFNGEMFRDGSDLGGWYGEFESVATIDGFATEAFITAADLGMATWSLSAGGTVGLDVSVDLGSPSEPAGCPRLGQFTIQLPQATIGNCAAGCDVGEFCTPQLE